MRMNEFRRITAAIVIVAITGLGLPLRTQAAMVGTDASLAGEARNRIEAMLDRAEVRKKLEAYGVSVADVRARLASLTDEEAASLGRQIDTLPAGGFAEELIGAAVFVFLVLLITDILGFTKVFPFTKPVR
jgi:hypothetical protein